MTTPEGARVLRLPTKIYEGTRRNGVVDVRVNGDPLDPRFDLCNHSPNGFEWGYGGSGPAQLALAILADHLEDDDRALELYEEFKRAVVVNLSGNDWTLTAEQIEHALTTLPEVE